MSNLSTEILSRLTDVQGQIWQTVSLTVSEATGHAINFGSPLCTAARTSDLYSELTQPMMVIQFAFTSQPECSQVVLLPQETVLQLLSLITNSDVTEVDENSVADLRSCLEGIVQGICLSIGNVKNETVVASGLTLRFQIFTFPPNLQRANELIRTQVAIMGDDVNGSIVWLMDSESAHHALGMREVEEETLPYQPFGGGSPFPAFGGGGVDTKGLDILMDVPLEISVELGRVKMLVRDIVELTTGSIVEIDKAAGEPVDVMVNGRLVARGEVVVIEDNFGVRITEILNPNERLSGRLGEAA
ncbi:MAG: flagellar motor switch protein FliN [Fimbriimonas sp.]